MRLDIRKELKNSQDFIAANAESCSHHATQRPQLKLDSYSDKIGVAAMPPVPLKSSDNDDMIFDGGMVYSVRDTNTESFPADFPFNPWIIVLALQPSVCVLGL